MEQHIGIFQLLQRCPEGVHQMMGQLTDKTHGIGKNHIQIVRNLQLTGRGIQGIKEPVVGGNARAGQLIEQGGFARVGVAHNGHHRHGILHPALPLDPPDLPHLLQLRFQPVDPFPDVPPVAFQLGFAGAPGANAAALTGKALSHAGEPGQQIFILGKLHLKPALSGLGPLGKNIHNQGAAVQNRHADDFFQGPDISRGKLVVKDHHGGCGGLHQHPHLLGFALADKAVRIRGMAVLQHFPGAEAAGGFQQCFQLLQGFLGSRLLGGKAVGIESNQNGPLLGGLIHHFFHNTLPWFDNSIPHTPHSEQQKNTRTTKP